MTRSNRNSLDQLLSPAFLDELEACIRDFGIRGCAIVLLRDTVDTWEKKALTHGKRDGIGASDVTPQTSFPLGQDPLLISLTLLRLLKDRGMDEKVTLGDVLALDGGGGSEVDLEAGRLKDLTVEQVLSHQTGLPGLDPSLVDGQAGVEALAKITPVQADRTSHRSPLDIQIAIRLVEHLSSTDWVTAVHTHLLAPMEIENKVPQGSTCSTPMAAGTGAGTQSNPDQAPGDGDREGGGIWLTALDMGKLLKHLPLIKEYHTASQPLVAAPTVPLMWPDAHVPVTAGLGMVQSTHRNHRIWQHATLADMLARSYGCSAHVGRFPNLGLGWAVLTNSPDGVYLAAFVKLRLLERLAGLPSSGWDKALQHERKKELIRIAVGSQHDIRFGRRAAPSAQSGTDTPPTSLAGSQSPALSDLSTTATCGSPSSPAPPPRRRLPANRVQEILGTWTAPGLKPWVITREDILPVETKPAHSLLPPWAARTGARRYERKTTKGWWRCWTVWEPENAPEENKYGLPLAVTIEGDQMRVRGLAHDDPRWELVLLRQQA